MKKMIFFAMLACFLGSTAMAQTSGWAFAAALDSIVANPKYRPENPGFAIIIIQNGQIVYERQRGMINLQKQLPVRAETIFNIGSITKQFTAAAIFLLEEKGLLRLSDPVQKHLPELPDFGATITLQHLMSHTSGIPDHFEIAGFMKNWLPPPSGATPCFLSENTTPNPENRPCTSATTGERADLN